SYRTSTSFAVLSSHVASYMISVRQTRGLPRASFRFHITMDTLAFGYVLTATRSHSRLSPIRVRPCWANKKRTSLFWLVPHFLKGAFRTKLLIHFGYGF